MGILNIKKNHKSKEKSKETTIVDGKSKKKFHFPFIFKHSNKRKNIKEESNEIDEKTHKEQGYYFVSYSKRMAISRASSHNQNDLIYNNPYCSSETIEYIKTSINPIPFEEQINSRKRKLICSTHSSENSNLKRIHSDKSVKEKISNESIGKNNVTKVTESNSHTVSNSNQETDDYKPKPKHKSTISQLNDFLNEEKKEGLDNSSSNDDRDITSSSTYSYYKEKSTLLNTEEPTSIEIIRDDKVKPIETVNTPSSTQITMGKDNSTIDTFSSEVIELDNSLISETKIDQFDVKEKISEESEKEYIIKSNEYKNNNQCIHEKRKRRYSQNSVTPVSDSSIALIQEKKFKMDEKSSKDPNLVKNYKKLMGIKTRSSGPYIQDTSIVQGVKGPWKIVETTTMTTGIATSPEIIHQTFGNGTIAKHMVFRSPSLPSLKNTTINNKRKINMITRHQIMSDSLLNEINGIQKSELVDDHIKPSNEESDVSSRYSSTSSRSDISSQTDHKSSVFDANKRHNSKLTNQKLKNKSLKAVLKHDSKKLNENQNNEKRSIRMTINSLNNPSVQSHTVSNSNTITTTSNTIADIHSNSNDTETVTDVTTHIAPITTSSVTNVNTNTNTDVTVVPRDMQFKFNDNTSLITTDLKSPNQSNSFTLFQDTSGSFINQNSSSLLSNPPNTLLKDDLIKQPKTESQENNSLTIIKYHLNKPSYLKNEEDFQYKSEDSTNINWNSRITMEARYFLTSNRENDDNQQKTSTYPDHRETSNHVEAPSSEKKEQSKEVERYINSNQESSYDDCVLPNLDIVRKRKNTHRYQESPKKQKSNEDLDSNIKNSSLKYYRFDPSLSYDNMTTMATITSLGKHDEDQISENSLYNNYYIGLSYIKNEKGETGGKEKGTESIHHKESDYQSTNRITEKGGKSKLSRNKQNTVNEEDLDNEEKVNNIALNNQNKEKNEEINVIDTTFTSLEFKDAAITSVENDIASTSYHQNNSSYIPKAYSTLPKNQDSLSSNIQKKVNLTSQNNNLMYPKLIDVPGNSSMTKAYAMGGTNEEDHDVTILTPTLNYSTAGATAADDTITSLPKIHPKLQDNSKIQILSTHSTQKTTTYNYLPMELLESSDNMNITNFQIHTCKDSVLSPLIPCVACSNENKWKNRKLTTRIRHKFKNWMSSITHSKKKNKDSMVYTSSATVTIPIYFGDQLASPEDQNRHHQQHYHSTSASKKGSGSSVGLSYNNEKKWKSKTRSLKNSSSSPSFLFPSHATQNPLPISNYSNTIPNNNYIIETKKSNAEILPIANDINKKNSSIRIKKAYNPTPSTSLSTPIINTKKDQMDSQNYSNMEISHSQMRPHPKSSHYQNRHKGIIYYNNSRTVLEKDAISHQGSAPNLALERSEELKNSFNKVSVHEGYNESIFSSPITPELKPMEIDTNDENNNNINNNISVLKTKSSIVSISISSTTSSVSIAIKQTEQSRSRRPKRLQSKPSKHQSKTLQSLYQDICVLGLSIDRLAEKYSSSNLNRKL